MNLLIDTTTIRLGERIVNELQEKGKTENDYELIETANMHISHCLGCNYCWLKTPGVCVIKDDYEPILKKINKADQERNVEQYTLSAKSRTHDAEHFLRGVLL